MKAVLVCVLATLVVAAAGYPSFEPYHYGYSGYPVYHGYPHNHEYDYRQFGGYPVHVGNGQFYFLGIFSGSCDDGQNYGFYFAADATDSYIVCDHGRAHHFQCPKGTKNRDHSYYISNHKYGFNQICGEHINYA